jgi:hypothetical protein
MISPGKMFYRKNNFNITNFVLIINDVFVGVWVNVGTNNCPGLQAERNKLVIMIMIIAI